MPRTSVRIVSSPDPISTLVLALGVFHQHTERSSIEGLYHSAIYTCSTKRSCEILAAAKVFAGYASKEIYIIIFANF